MSDKWRLIYNKRTVQVLQQDYHIPCDDKENVFMYVISSGTRCGMYHRAVCRSMKNSVFHHYRIIIPKNCFFWYLFKRTIYLNPCKSQ